MLLTQSQLFALMIAAGMAVPVMAAMNASLGRAVGNPSLTVAVLCGVALCTALFLLCLGSPGPAVRSWLTNVSSYLDGVLFFVYIGSIKHAAPPIV